MQRFDLIVIGGGPAGYHAALYAAAKGMSVLLAEARALGGVCLNEGCVPTKCFLYSAKMLRHVKEANRYGVVGQEGTPVLDQNAVRLRKNKAVKRLTLGVRNSLKQAGVTVWTERVELQGKSEAGFVVAAGDTEAEGRFVLIATGSSPVILPIEGLAAALERGEAMTSAEALELTEIPARLLVIGGGVIGLEMAAYFAEAGSAVTVAEAAPAIAGRSDADIAARLKKTLTKKGIEFLTSSTLLSVGQSEATIATPEGNRNVVYDKLLLAVGRKPRWEGAGIDRLGVKTERGAVVTDDRMQTNIKGIYAAGDVNGKSMLAHTAYREGEVAVNNMLGDEDRMSYDAIPAVIYTDPEVASVGLTAEEAERQGIAYREVVLPMLYSGRYAAEVADPDAVIRMLSDRETGRVLGCHAIGSYAGEYIAQVAAMMTLGTTTKEGAEVVYPHPTVAELIRECLIELNRKESADA